MEKSLRKNHLPARSVEINCRHDLTHGLSKRFVSSAHGFEHKTY